MFTCTSEFVIVEFLLIFLISPDSTFLCFSVFDRSRRVQSLAASPETPGDSKLCLVHIGIPVFSSLGFHPAVLFQLLERQPVSWISAQAVENQVMARWGEFRESAVSLRTSHMNSKHHRVELFVRSPVDKVGSIRT